VRGNAYRAGFPSTLAVRLAAPVPGVRTPFPDALMAVAGGVIFPGSLVLIQRDDAGMATWRTGISHARQSSAEEMRISFSQPPDIC
jgi:hypothetical protein